MLYIADEYLLYRRHYVKSLPKSRHHNPSPIPSSSAQPSPVHQSRPVQLDCEHAHLPYITLLPTEQSKANLTNP
jgi:hypothetical protein